MIKIKKINSIQEMTEDQKEKYTELVYKNCSSIVYNFLQSNKDYIKKQLSGSMGRVFETEVLKQKKLKQSFLKQILEKLDDIRAEKFNNKILKYLFNQDKDLADAITINREFEEKQLITYFFKENINANLIKSIFECLGIETGITEEEFKKVAEQVQNESFEKELEKAKEEIESLKIKNKEEKAELEKKLKENEKHFKEKQKESESEVERLKDEINELKNNKPKTEIKTVYVERPKTNESEEKDKIIEEVEEDISEISNPLKNEINLRIDFQDAIDDLEERTLLGVVKAEGIQPNNGMIIVTPIVPIITENSNINREEFINNVDYRSDYSTFVLFITPNLLKDYLSGEDADNYQYYTSDEKFSVLFEAFCKKIIFFRPEFAVKEGERRKLNAVLIDDPVNYEDFNNSTFVPSMDLTKKEFENKINGHEDLILKNYPASLSSSLRYVFIKDTIYEINYVPSTNQIDGRYIQWKFNGQDNKPPYRKLDIKVINEFNDKYIITPGAFNDIPDSIYVKNIMLIQPSVKSNSLFDEDEFIYNVSENAKSKNLYYSEEDLKNFHVAVKSSNLVILAGPSGIGKTRLPMVYANTLGLDSARNTVLFVPISPSYLEPEDVLGYIRPISSKDGELFNAEYMESQTGLVSFLLDAAEHKDRIHLVIFDEMNLSQIEHWFAPFISLLEQDPDSRVLNLYADNLAVKNGEKYPSSISIGENVFFVGTVNIDETTKQISDRLLDRAIVINLAAPSFTNLKEMGEAKQENYPEITYSRFSTAMAKVENAALKFNDKEFSLINDLNTLLTESVYNKSISFRSLNKMAIYLSNSNGLLSRNEAIDFVISQIVVKKINGSREELEGILSDDDTQGILKILDEHSDVSEFAKTRKLVTQKIQELNKYGFTR